MDIENGLLKEGERIDDLQCSGLNIIQNPERFCFGMDAVLLAGFVVARQGSHLLDLGTGTGILPILLSAKTEASHLTGLEIQEESADMARRSVILNGLRSKIDIVTGDIKEAGSIFAPASFEVICCNPPYMADNNGIKNPQDAKAIARHEILCSLEDVLAAAKKLLVSNGRFFMVHRPTRLAEIIQKMSRYGLEPKRLRMVHATVDKEPSMVLIEALKGGKSFMKVEPPLIIYDSDGEYTKELKVKYKF